MYPNINLPVNSKITTSNLGFSLIELLVVMGIIGILSTTTVAVFSRFNQQQNITIASKNVRNDLAEAKANALSQVVVRCKEASEAGPLDSPGILRGYQITFNHPLTRNYSLREVCELNTSPPGILTVLPTIIKTKTLPTGVSFDTSTSAYIRFFSLTGGSTGGAVVLTSSSVTEPLGIEVSSEGVIQ